MSNKLGSSSPSQVSQHANPRNQDRLQISLSSLPSKCINGCPILHSTPNSNSWWWGNGRKQQGRPCTYHAAPHLWWYSMSLWVGGYIVINWWCVKCHSGEWRLEPWLEPRHPPGTGRKSITSMPIWSRQYSYWHRTQANSGDTNTTNRKNWCLHQWYNRPNSGHCGDGQCFAPSKCNSPCNSLNSKTISHDWNPYHELAWWLDRSSLPKDALLRQKSFWAGITISACLQRLSCSTSTWRGQTISNKSCQHEKYPQLTLSRSLVISNILDSSSNGYHFWAGYALCTVQKMG